MTKATFNNRVACLQMNKENFKKLNRRVPNLQLKMVIVGPAKSARISHVRLDTHVEQSSAILIANKKMPAANTLAESGMALNPVK